MPYISSELRAKFDPCIDHLQDMLDDQSWDGELNYIISRLVAGRFSRVTRYQTIARVCGVLSNVKDEFYRRLAAPYENMALLQSGDLPEFDEIRVRLHVLMDAMQKKGGGAK